MQAGLDGLHEVVVETASAAATTVPSMTARTVQASAVETQGSQGIEFGALGLVPDVDGVAVGEIEWRLADGLVLRFRGRLAGSTNELPRDTLSNQSQAAAVIMNLRTRRNYHPQGAANPSQKNNRIQGKKRPKKTGSDEHAPTQADSCPPL